MLFPPVEYADDDGLLAIGGDLEIDTLCDAYRSGIFPWPIEGLPLLWFAPPQRGILHFDQFHVSRRLARDLRRNPFEVRFDTAFEEVIRACSGERRGEEGTWITPDIIAAYTRLHRVGIAHSVEAWRDGKLAGGFYGVTFGAYFCGESMFYHESGASKAALIAAVQHFKERGATWLDTQMITPHFASSGACEIPRPQFMKMLQEALAKPVNLFEPQRGLTTDEHG